MILLPALRAYVGIPTCLPRATNVLQRSIPVQPRQRPGNRLGRLVAAFSAAALALLGVVAVPASATNPGGDGKLAFTQRNSAGNTVVLTVNHDGTGVTQLTTSGNHFTPTWSPGGNQMAFVYYPFAIGIPVLGVMNADGTGQRKLP